MSDVMGLLNLRDVSIHHELLANRPLASVPFAAKYRLIDFTLSGLVNAGVDDVGILLPARANSILDHIRAGKEWNLSRISGGIFYMPPDEADVNLPEESTINSYYKNLRFVERGLKKYIIISFCDCVHNADFADIMDFHLSKRADVTLLYCKQMRELKGKSRALTLDRQERVTGISEFEKTRVGDNLFLRCMLLESKLFRKIVEKAHAERKDGFGDVLIPLLGELRIYGCKYNGYVAKIDSLEAYYKANMDLLRPAVWKELFCNDDRRIHTKVRNEVPAKYMDNSSVHNCLVANGAWIEGTVENSILSRRVVVSEGAVVHSSILMFGCFVSQGAVLDGVVCDKNVFISPGKKLSGRPGKLLFIPKGTEL